MTHKNLKEAFNLFDLNGDGQIEPRELKSVLGTKDSDLSDETWELLIKEFDSNNDGQINFEEFKNLMISLHQRLAQNYTDFYSLFS